MQRRDGLPLAHLMLQAGRAFDAALREELTTRGWPGLTAAQSLVFAYLEPQGTPPAELARRLGTTRQAQQELVAGLVRLGLLETVADPRRRRGRLVRLTGAGRQLAADAADVLARFEDELGGRAADLRRLLAEVTDVVVRRAGTGTGARPTAAP